MANKEVKLNTYKVGVVCPEFPDQKYITSRYEIIWAESKEEAIQEYISMYDYWLREDEYKLVKIVEVIYEHHGVEGIEAIMIAEDRREIYEEKVVDDKRIVLCWWRGEWVCWCCNDEHTSFFWGKYYGKDYEAALECFNNRD